MFIRTMRRSRTAILILATMVLSPLKTSLAAATYEPGQVFPNIVLPRIEDGQALSVAQFRGQRLMLHIFASW